MVRLMPPFFVLMVCMWILAIYVSSDIVIKIEKEEEIHVYLTNLRGKVDKMLEHTINKTNTTYN